MLNKIFCWLFGHDFITEGKMDNGRSQWGAHRCMRCGFNHLWQYDYI